MNGIPPDAFPYADWLPPSGAVREVAESGRTDDHLTERHLQCIWSDDRLRPGGLMDDDGEPVEVIEPGRWNLEAGPDFLDAILLVGADRRRLAGDVELHIHPRAWRQHRHHDDPNYSRVVAHVTYLPGSRADDGLPDSVLRIALRDALRRNPAFLFEDIDLGAYPHAVIPATPRPCALALGSDPDRAAALLLAAGRHRMELKRQRMAALIGQRQDWRQACYEAFLAALGYKLNTRACRQVAQALPLADWPAHLEPLGHYARLLLAAGLLPDTDRGEDEPSQALIRQLWDLAWRNPVPRQPAPPAWRLGALRPANHPVRRLAVAAACFGTRDPIESLWEALPFDPPDAWFKHVMQRLMQRADLPCWHDRLTLHRRAATPGQPALLGQSAAAVLVTNVVVPLVGCLQPTALPVLLPALPAETLSAPMRATAAHLLGRDHNPALYGGSGLLQQGLLQIHGDFCLNAHTGCAGCTLAAALRSPPNT
ncbi:MAG: DUF2851 family protein [Lentisphaerae bacterium]|nr:DUF2851 family protein [Lentisphaerota bacterium]